MSFSVDNVVSDDEDSGADTSARDTRVLSALDGRATARVGGVDVGEPVKIREIAVGALSVDCWRDGGSEGKGKFSTTFDNNLFALKAADCIIGT